jgi:hypothetical protein
MVVHQAKGIDPNFPQSGELTDQSQKLFAVFVIEKDPSAPQSSIHRVVIRAGVFYP